MQQLQTAPTGVPDDITRVAREQLLGEPQNDYTVFELSRHWHWRNTIALYALCLEAICLIAAVIFLVVLFSTPSLPDKIFSLLFVCISVFHFIFALVRPANKTYQLYPCEEGIILKPTKKKIRTLRWDEIESVWSSTIYMPLPRPLYQIHCHDGQTLPLRGQAKDSLELAQTIEQLFTQRHLPAYLARYRAGETLNFGPLTLSTVSISKNGRLLAWEQIADITLHKKRRLRISLLDSPRSPRIDIAVGRMPNFVLFQAIINSESNFQLQGEEKPVAQRTRQSEIARQKAVLKVDDMPEEIALLAYEYRMGERRTDSGLGRSRLVTGRVLRYIAIAYFVFLVLIAGFFYLISRFALPSPYTALDTISRLLDFTLQGVTLAIPLFFCAFFFVSFTGFFRQRKRYTYIFEQGLILKQGQQTPIVCRWDQIAVIWRATFIGKRPMYAPLLSTAYTLQLRDGSRLALTQITTSQGQFRQLLKESIVAHQLPEVLAAYQAGQTLDFGPVQVNQTGISHGKRLLPWSQVRSVTLENNALVIYSISKRSPWKKLSAAQIPNLFVLFSLVDQVREHELT